MVAPTANQMFMGLPEPLEAPTKYAPDVILKIELALTVLLEFFLCLPDFTVATWTRG